MNSLMENSQRAGTQTGALKVLVALDGSEAATNAAGLIARTLTGHTQLRLITVLSYENYPMGPFQEPLSDASSRMAEIRRREREAVAGARKVLGDGHEISVIHRFGHPGFEILAEIQEWSPDLVVTGRRGLGLAKGLLLGSVSQYLLRHCETPLLIVP
ncbi:MAG: universal stress protein [Actinomycetota bacterium]